MFYTKPGDPEEGEVVMCRITNIQYNSVFGALTEYPGRSGMIHISEISPGRIRNIRDFVKEDKLVVCKILRINRERNQIDLTLRRVTELQRRNKINELKREQLAEKIIEFAAQKLSKDPKAYYQEVMGKISESYDSTYAFFEDVVNQKATFSEAGFSKDEEKLILPVIQQRITIPEVEVQQRILLTCTEPDGIEHIKQAFAAVKQIGKDQSILIYEGAGRYRLRIKAPDYKTAEKLLEDTDEAISAHFKKLKHTLEFVRLET